MTESSNLATQPKTPAERMWAVATWSSLLLFQAVCGLFFAAMAVLANLGYRDNNIDVEREKIFTAVVGTIVIALVVSTLFLLKRRPAMRGVGIGLAASAIIFAIGAAGYVLWLY
ncbi:hypothetical protein ACTXG7_19885 [Mycolicibacterium sp. Dal123E01]|uniref:hypothetical protein n=1 Tax=Mycolicibacterium sp. Dal123E01 TaxID=3457578 RepID=UPI00403EEDDF